MDMSRIRGPYVRFCERDEANLISSPHPTRFIYGLVRYGALTETSELSPPVPGLSTWILKFFGVELYGLRW